MSSLRNALVVLAVVLALIGGFVDGAGYLLLQHVFVAHQSGNTAASAVALTQGDWSLVVRRGTPIALFVLGVGLAAAGLEFAGRRHVRSLTALTLGVETALLVAFVVAGACCFSRTQLRTASNGPFVALLALLVLAMGVQTATLRKIGNRTVRTTYVTGMLTHLAEEVVGYVVERHDAHQESARSLADRRRRIRVLLLIWSTYALGAVVGGFVETAWSIYAFVLPAAVLVAAAAVDLRWPWHAPSEDPLHAEASAAANS
ncbi:MAG: YoaK family protein [Acidothermaceae bacterium]